MEFINQIENSLKMMNLNMETKTNLFLYDFLHSSNYSNYSNGLLSPEHSNIIHSVVVSFNTNINHIFNYDTSGDFNTLINGVKELDKAIEVFRKESSFGSKKF